MKPCMRMGGGESYHQHGNARQQLPNPETKRKYDAWKKEIRSGFEAKHTNNGEKTV